MIPIAVGVAVAATAAIAAALVLSRKFAPPPRPDRVQLTVTGNARAASLSPDGARLAFAERGCDEAGYCTYQIVIQDTDGSNRLVISRNAANVWRTAWTRDGRFIAFMASYLTRVGTFAVSTLGGTPKYLGCCDFDVLGGDTLLLAVNSDSIGWVRRITAHDGITLDSIPLYEPGDVRTIEVTRLPFSNRLLVAPRMNWGRAPELRLIDLRGAVIDRMTPVFGSLGRGASIRWVPSRKKLVVFSQRALSGTEVDVLTIDVTASGIGVHIDTVLAGLQSGDGVFDVSPDGERLVSSPGSIDAVLSRIDARGPKGGRFASTQLLSSTTLVRGLISPAGDRVVVAREIPTKEGLASNFSILPRDGGAESQIARDVPNLRDIAWSLDGATIMYLHGIGANTVRLAETDTTGRQTREIARLDASAATLFHPLPDGAICLIPSERRSLSIIRRRGKEDVTWRAPNWIRMIWSVSLSPDTKSLAVLAMYAHSDSIAVATVDMENGRFTKLAVFPGEYPDRITWLKDGSLMFDLHEKQGAFALFTIRPGGPLRRLGAFPYSDEYTHQWFSVSKDGRHMVAFSYGVKTDVEMIRNFGKILRR
jgi:Tol biopolymer transport system component